MIYILVLTDAPIHLRLLMVGGLVLMGSGFLLGYCWGRTGKFKFKVKPEPGFKQALMESFVKPRR